MLSSESYLHRCEDTNEAIFNLILSKSPTHPSEALINKLFERGKKLKFNYVASPIRRKSHLENSGLTTSQVAEFNSTPGSLHDYFDLISKLLTIDPDERITTTQALNHKFFDWVREYIKTIHIKYPLNIPDFPHIHIYNCIERKWVMKRAFEIYNSQSSLKWYQHRILFHAIDIFDKYLDWLHKHNKYIANEEQEYQGRFHSYHEVILRFYTCLYIYHKYCMTMNYPCSWKDFAPIEYVSDEFLSEAEGFELLIIKNVCIYNLYNETLLEMPPYFKHEVTEDKIRDMLIKYGGIKEWVGRGNVSDLYRILFNINKDGTPLTLPKVIKK